MIQFLQLCSKSIKKKEICKSLYIFLHEQTILQYKKYSNLCSLCRRWYEIVIYLIIVGLLTLTTV